MVGWEDVQRHRWALAAIVTMVIGLVLALVVSLSIGLIVLIIGLALNVVATRRARGIGGR